MKTLVLFLCIILAAGLAVADESALVQALQAKIAEQAKEISRQEARYEKLVSEHHRVVTNYKTVTGWAAEWKTLAQQLQAELDVINTPTTNSTVIVTPMAPGSYLVRDANGKSRIVTEGVPGVFTAR